MNNLKKVLTKKFYQIKNKISPPKYLYLDDFECNVKKIKNFNNNNNIELRDYYDKNTDDFVCGVKFEIEQDAYFIRSISVFPNYRGKKLFNQMLFKLKNDGKSSNINKIYGESNALEIASWYENRKDDKTIKKIDGCDDNLPKYEIYI